MKKVEGQVGGHVLSFQYLPASSTFLIIRKKNPYEIMGKS